ncbi:hypothetical protein SAMN05428960_3514 [Mitsuaria sp. PDC51]|uniref:hypothetical protein n=1 Tax=Mitsuaria sp. PDC51 TaxID=1881035 RepID=UPI0008E60F14|nr:hypothetical protein [Mitsuaria sp. PDC51]SFR93504.1 hypothetical protein SAMN05428960_3514 [Mitsuaria sp. PDC51]
MARIDDVLAAALRQLPEKPTDDAKQESKKRYSELVSQQVALAIADELRHRGLKEARPYASDKSGDSGAERRMAGGLGAKKVDVTWATEESGLLCAVSVKTINFRDSRTKNYQKNLINRRGDMLMEAVTLHRRFPYAVLAGFFFLDHGAEHDGTLQRRSTFLNAHARLQLFSGRSDPAGREEQFERFYLILLDASPMNVGLRAFAVGAPKEEVPLSDVLDDLLKLVAQRNPDFYEFDDGKLKRAS